MRDYKRPLFLLLTMMIGALLISSCTIVKIKEETSGDKAGDYSTWTKTGTGFVAFEYVESVWEERMIPIYNDEAVEYTMLMAALAENRQAGSERCGLLRETGEPSYIFKVRGKARVLKFDDSSRNGVIRVDHEPFDDVADAVIQVGPVLKGTTLRDSVEFITFTEVGNQLQFADLAKELNMRMKADSIDPIDLTSIQGRTIEYMGAFRLDLESTLDDIIITPLVLNLVEDSGN